MSDPYLVPAGDGAVLHGVFREAPEGESRRSTGRYSRVATTNNPRESSLPKRTIAADRGVGKLFSAAPAAGRATDEGMVGTTAR